MFEGWDRVGGAALGLLPERVGAPVNDILGEMRSAAAGLGYLEWVTYRDAAELHTQLVEPEMVTDVRMFDALTRCATQIATEMSIFETSWEGLLHRAISFRDRLPTTHDRHRRTHQTPHTSGKQTGPPTHRTRAHPDATRGRRNRATSRRHRRPAATVLVGH